MILVHRIKLKPSQMAARYFRRACGVARFAWNWALAQWQAKFASGERGMSGYSLVKEWNATKLEIAPWALEVSKWAPQKSIQNLGDAYGKFFEKAARYPRFKKKGVSRDSFYLGADAFAVKGKRIRIPKLGWIRMSQELRFPGILKNVTISREANEWFASIMVELPEDYKYPHQCETQATVGIDLGVKDLAVLSDGTVFNGPKAFRTAQRKLRRANKAVSRKVKGSANRRKAVAKLSRAHVRVKRIRSDYSHKMTVHIVRRFRWIGIEDLNVRGMVKNRKLSKALSDQGFGEIRRQLEYKSKLAGANVAVAARFFPSSKTCSSCEFKLEKLELSERSWVCPACGQDHDRDLNAAKNLELVALRYRDTLNACGDDVRQGAQCPQGPVLPAIVREADIGIKSQTVNSQEKMV